MNKRFPSGIAVTLALASALAAAGSPQSLRGDADVMAPSLDSHKVRFVNDKDPIPRSFAEQPPLVPHEVEKYVVNLRQNECLDCHSKEKAKEKDSTEISESHYQTADGRTLSSLAPRRYFCSQCHVPQAKRTEPLVENLFQPAKVVKAE